MSGGMDVRTRQSHREETLASHTDGRESQIWTAMVCIVESFDAQKQTCVLQPAVKATKRKPDGKLEEMKMPLLQDVPVSFPQGGGTTLTFPIKKGDEAVVMFASRNIDAWWQQGGVQGAMDRRTHDLSDGIAFVGLRSQPRKLPNVSTTSTQLRSDDGKHVVDVHPKDGITHTSTAKVNIKAPAGTFEIDQLKVKGGVTLEKGADGKGGWLKAETGLQAPIVNGIPGAIPA